MKYKLEALIEIVPPLLKQGCPSHDESGACMYRGQNGTKCAVGHAIADAAYHPGIENELVTDHKVHDCLVKSGFNMDQQLEQMFLECQEIHDQTNPDLWRDEFIALAEVHLTKSDYEKFLAELNKN